MPELPEVETARSLIAEQALHRRIVGVDDADSSSDARHSPGELRSALTGRSSSRAHRRGKTMWLETSGVGDAATPVGPGAWHPPGHERPYRGHGPGAATVAEGGDPYRYDTRPRSAEWRRFTLTLRTAAAWCSSTRAGWDASGSTRTSARSAPDAAQVTRRSSAR